MKYVVNCHKEICCTFVVDADSDQECDDKLQRGEYEFKTEEQVTRDDYNGYEFDSHDVYTGEGESTVICSIDDLCKFLGTTVDHIERFMYKNTQCGMPISWDDRKIQLVGYVEGAHCDGPTRKLYFPFTIEEFNNSVEDLEIEADKMWHEWNDEKEAGDSDQGL